MLRTLGVIPARYASTRFRGKPLAPLGNRTLLEEVWRRSAGAEKITRLIIATDDERIELAASGFGAEVMMTSPDHPSGTDRAAEVLRRCKEQGHEFDVVLNVQGDEPMISPVSLDRLLACFEEDQEIAMATLSEPLQSPDDLSNPNVVKVVTTKKGRALYFSRAAIPGRRHQGIYAYRAEILVRLTALPPSPLELSEKLEQLRALESDFVIHVISSDFHSIGVDTPEDLERVSALLAQTTEDSAT
jgi:3-deoxy-manno-octulosonate cytidylyltransferase (CMP-KDO synthetase)